MLIFASHDVIHVRVSVESSHPLTLEFSLDCLHKSRNRKDFTPNVDRLFSDFVFVLKSKLLTIIRRKTLIMNEG